MGSEEKRQRLAPDLFKLRQRQSDQSAKALTEAAGALVAGDLVLLERLKAEGFNPWRPCLGASDSSNSLPIVSWTGLSLEEPSGQSLAWLAESFPGFVGDLPACSTLFSFSNDMARKACPTPCLMMLDMYRPEEREATMVVFQLRQSPHFPELLERLLERPWFAHYWRTPALQAGDEHNRLGKKNGWDHCAATVVYGHRNGLAPQAQREATTTLLKSVPPVIHTEALLGGLCSAAIDGVNIEPFHLLTSCLTLKTASFELTEGQLNAGPREYWRERVMAFLSRGSHAREWEMDLGVFVLFGGRAESIRCALEKGWIHPIRIDSTISCESPYYAAYDKARLEAIKGREIDMRPRFEKIERVINASELDQIQKNKLLDALNSPLAERPAKADGRISLPSSLRLSPQMMLLHCSPGRAVIRSEQAALELSKAGFLLSEAVAQAKLIGCSLKENRPEWLSRALETEAIRLATGPARSAAKRACL